MTHDDRFARRLPPIAFPAFLRPIFDESWSYVAIAGLVTAVLLMVSHVFGIASSSHLSWRHWIQVVFDPPTGLRIAGALAFAAAVIALHGEATAVGRAAAQRSDVVLTATAALGAVMVVGAVIGAVDWITFLGSGVRVTLDAVFFEVAVMVLSGAACLWSLAELNARRRG